MTNDEARDTAPPAGEDVAETDAAESNGIDELAAAIAQRDEYLDQLQRSRAEFINFRRRTEQERALLRPLVTKDVLANLLPVLDDVDRAVTSIPESERDSVWVKGVEMIQAKLNGAVERLGVRKLEALGKPFDPSLHEAVATQPDSSGSVVVEVFQPGYLLGELLVRPAMVMTGDPDPSSGVDEENLAFNA